MHFVRQLLPLAVLFGFLGVLGGTTPARADVTGLDPVATGQTITIKATYTNSPAGSPASIDASGGVNGSFTSATASGGSGVQASGTGTKQIKTSPDTSGNTANVITITATFSCQGNGPVSFLLFQAGSTTTKSTQANCSGTSSTSGGGSLIINPNSQAISGNVTINAQCSAGATLAASPEVGKFMLATVNGAAINVTGSSVTCVNGGSLSATYQCVQNGNTTLTLSGATGASGSLACGNAPNNSAGTSVTQSNNLTLANPNNSGTSSPVSISIAPDVIPCGGSAQISVTSSLATLSATAEGAVVNLYTTNGVIEPKTGVIKDGKFVTTLKAPTTGGVATVNASVGSVTNYRDVKFDCSIGIGSTSTSPVVANPPIALPQTSSPPPPPPPPAGVAPLGPGGFPVIAPPNTGDAGLKALLD